MAAKRQAGNSFTLIELLVVVAIIMLLAALLLPALRNARDAGKSAKCQGNLHQIGLAFQMYFSDNRDGFPPFWDASIGPWSPLWSQLLYPYLNAPACVPGQLALTIPVFRCPSSVIDESLAKWIVWNQYGYNWYSLGGALGPGYPPPHLSAIRRPTEHLQVTETTDEATLPPNSRGWSANPGLVFARHRGRQANTLFVAGQVELKDAAWLNNPGDYTFNSTTVPWNYYNQ